MIIDTPTYVGQSLLGYSLAPEELFLAMEHVQKADEACAAIEASLEEAEALLAE